MTDKKGRVHSSAALKRPRAHGHAVVDPPSIIWRRIFPAIWRSLSPLWTTCLGYRSLSLLPFATVGENSEDGLVRKANSLDPKGVNTRLTQRRWHKV